MASFGSSRDPAATVVAVVDVLTALGDVTVTGAATVVVVELQ